MEKQRIEEMYQIFERVYKDRKINILFFQNAYSVSIEKGSISEEDRKEFKEFCDEFINCLSDYATKEDCDSAYKEHVTDFFSKNKILKEDILVKCQSNLKILVGIEHEILTKRDEKLEKNAMSALCYIKYKAPSGPEIKFEQLTLELSRKDLSELKEEIEKIENEMKSIED